MVLLWHNIDKTAAVLSQQHSYCTLCIEVLGMLGNTKFNLIGPVEK